MKPIYGPIPSWRLGSSLGIDPVCNRNVCSFDCTYCQLGRTTEKTTVRRVFVKTSLFEEEIKKSLKQLKNKKVKADMVTFSGTGEPTLAKNLGEMADITRKYTNLPIAILTNSSLMHKREVRDDLNKIDFVIAKLDAPNEALFKEINQPAKSLTFKKVFDGMKEFRREFKGRFALQMMFIDKNKNHAENFVKLAKILAPDEIQVNTPLRPSAVKPLAKKEIKEIKNKFRGFNVITVYEAKKPKVNILNLHETLIRRPVLR